MGDYNDADHRALDCAQVRLGDGDEAVALQSGRVLGSLHLGPNALDDLEFRHQAVSTELQVALGEARLDSVARL